MNISTSFNPWFLILVGSFVAAACAYVGPLMVLKRMSLVGDALSHVALLGDGHRDFYRNFVVLGHLWL